MRISKEKLKEHIHHCDICKEMITLYCVVKSNRMEWKEEKIYKIKHEGKKKNVCENCYHILKVLDKIED